jgi:chemotaxis protein CheX
MKVEYINPFIDGVRGLFRTMLDCDVNRTNLAMSKEGTVGGDITALIGLSGAARGTVALSFPDSTAHAVVARMLHLETNEVEENISDGIAEAVNMVAGSAKAKFHAANGGSIIDLSLPTVVRGRSFVVNYPSSSTWLEIGFSSELGPFNMRVTFDMQGKEDRV